MAAEFSRELSVKVWAAQRHLFELGYWQGGAPGYGLRRQLVDQDGKPRLILGPGERKCITDERVKLVLGPREEIETIHRIYRLFVRNRLSEKEIAATLNSQGKLTDYGRPWSRRSVRNILVNEKYAGTPTFNKESRKLGLRLVENPPEEWVRSSVGIEPIVSPKLFRQAALLIKPRKKRLSSEAMLDGLRRLLGEKGTITSRLIDEAPYLPTPMAYMIRFGSIRNAYELIDFRPDRNFSPYQTLRTWRAQRTQLVFELTAKFKQMGLLAERLPYTNILLIEGTLTAAVRISLCKTTRRPSAVWCLTTQYASPVDVTIAGRMDRNNQGIQDYYLVPSADFPPPSRAYLSYRDEERYARYRQGDLDEVTRLLAFRMPKKTSP